MIELSACIEWLFADEADGFDDRIRAAADAGVHAVEFWSWRDKDISAIRSALHDTGIELNSFLSEPRGNLVDPDTHPAFLRGVRASCERALDLDCRRLVVLSGDDLPGAGRAEQADAVVAALSAAGPIAEHYGVTLVLEPLNTEVDHPGYFLPYTENALAILHRVDHPNVRLLYDLYHSVVMGEHPGEVLAADAHHVGHVQIADAPGRHEPGTGLIDWEDALCTLLTLGYRGRLGLEYKPQRDTRSSLTVITNVIAGLGDGP